MLPKKRRKRLYAKRKPVRSTQYAMRSIHSSSIPTVAPFYCVLRTENCVLNAIFALYTPLMRVLLSALLSLVFFTGVFAQYNDIPYRQRTNPLYWKNRPPYLGYWQQDVYYKLKANIDDATDIIDGTEELIYWNNSPDTLTFVYFHLYQNAFVKGSYLRDLELANKVKLRMGKK